MNVHVEVNAERTFYIYYGGAQCRVNEDAEVIVDVMKMQSTA